MNAPATRNLVAELRRLDPALVWQRLDQLSSTELEEIAYTWAVWARDKQLPPEDREWTYWLIKAGRGFGKTRTGAEMVRTWNAQGFRYVNLIGATSDDARDIMIEGESGILACSPPSARPVYKRGERRLIWPNGAVSLVFTADEPERLRGKQHEKLWGDELAAWRYAEAWDQAKFGLRLGKLPQAVITTTPRPTRVVKELMNDPATVVTNGTTYENERNLAPAFFNTIISKYEGTRLGRQELYAEYLEDNPNAVFRRADIDKGRISADELPVTRLRVAIAIDPAVTANVDSDETGIIGGFSAEMRDGREHYFIVGDFTESMVTTERWASKAVAHYHALEADSIVAEVNNGGDLVTSAIRAVDRNLKVIQVRATRGKAVRAEPVSALYEQGRVHHVGTFSKLEDQMCDYDPADTKQKSPDRMDALVWLVTHLSGNVKNQGFYDFTQRERQRIADAEQTAPQPTVTAPGWAQLAERHRRNG